MHIGIIGDGYWARIYKKTLSNMMLNSSNDIDSVSTYTHNYKELLNLKEIDCVIIATPAETHFEIARDSLISKKHVLLEKPFTTKSEEAIELFKYQQILLPGHIYLYHEGIEKLKTIIDNKELGKIKSVYSKRLNSSKYPNALWELAPHDLYIANYLLNQYGRFKNVMGIISHCFINIEYKDKVPFFIEVCTNYHIKTRQIIIKGSVKTVVFNEYDDYSEIIIISNRTSKKTIIPINLNISPLEKQIKYFFNCIKKSEISGEIALSTIENIRMLEEINKHLI